MAESSDYEILNKTFLKATQYVKSIVSKLSEKNLLEFYGYYKQATEGPCDKQKPSWYQMAEKQKWQAWSILENMDKESAMQEYINLLSKVDEEWWSKFEDVDVESKQQWVIHSSMLNQDKEINEADKTVFDWVKENNMEKLQEKCRNVNDYDEIDEDGLSLLHWATDRGHFEIVKYLVCNLKMNINYNDPSGQTPLHYAVMCGHENIIKFLLENGADRDIKDEDGLVACDLADSSFIKELFIPV